MFEQFKVQLKIVGKRRLFVTIFQLILSIKILFFYELPRETTVAG